MKVDVLTTFPEMFAPVLNASIVNRAREAGIISVAVHDLRNWTTDRHRTTDDYPYGGGAGMVMKPEPFFAAVEALRCPAGAVCAEEVILLSPQGERLSQRVAQRLSSRDHLILLCGHYEGVDERVRERLATKELSIGDYVLTGGELPAMVLIDAVSRLLPGALGAEEGAESDSFSDGLLEYPQYTRPAEFCGWRIPDVLLSGHHEEIRRWRRKESLRRTRDLRPDMLDRASLSEEDRELLGEIEEEERCP
jgi:tRNA (guanine37-N1)-methyltransferase